MSELLWGLAGAVAAMFLLVMSIVMFGMRSRRRYRTALQDPREALRKRINRVNEAFTEAATLMEELRRDVESQQAAREVLLTQAEEQQRLLEVNKDQAEKIRHILVGETKATIRAERRQQWMFFLLGATVSAAASVPIGIWVNSIS